MWEEHTAQTTAVKFLHYILFGGSDCKYNWKLKSLKSKIYVNTYRIIHNNGFSYEELMSRRSAIYSSIIDAMLCILNGMETFE